MSLFVDPPDHDTTDEPEGEGADLLDQVADFAARYVAFPSPAARDAVALWAAHCHAVAAFESTPRLALLSAEKGSGKTRTLEVLELLVPRPMHAVNATAAALFRAVEAHQPTLLFDECDTYFGPMARGEHEELRGLVNAGHRKGAVAYRCVGDPKHMEVKRFPAFCAVAVAGIGDLPPTILDRSVLVRMRRRAPGEQVEPFRRRKVAKVGDELREALAGWTAAHHDRLAEAEPEMPAGLVDRPADVWEALLAVADQAGGHWPARARTAALELNARVEADPSLGVALLRDLRAVFAIRDDDGNVTGWHEALSTEALLSRLTALEESPWGDLRGKPLDARGLARRLKPYEVRPTTIRAGEATPRGYRREHLVDAWARYLPHTRNVRNKRNAAGQRRCPCCGCCASCRRGRRPVRPRRPPEVHPMTGRVARCDYCGNLFPIRQARIYWAHVETLNDGRELCTTGIYCSEPCGEWSASRVGASRG